MANTEYRSNKSHLIDYARKFGGVTAENVFKLVKELIVLAERIYNGKGAQKRAAVLEVVRLLVDELPNSENKTKLLELLAGPIPEAIDLAVAIAKSGVFHSLVKRVKRCFKSCKCSCCC